MTKIYYLLIILSIFIIATMIMIPYEPFENNMNIKTVALIIPIHPKHFHFMENLVNKINSREENKIDIYLVFSSEEDHNNFSERDKIKKIILPNVDTDSIVSYKKFYALELLKNETQYDHFIVCDAEIDIIPENFNDANILKKISEFYTNKKVYAGKTNESHTTDITRTSAEIIANDSLKEITNDYTLYYWWSDLPVYKREHLVDFFSKFSYKNMNSNHFDHLIYLNYLLLYHGFTIVNITPIINHEWSLEILNTSNENILDMLKNQGYGFSFINKGLLNASHDYMIREGTFLIYHLDR
jgi:hypothetical protein